jgi:hypothetical protein
MPISKALDYIVNDSIVSLKQPDPALFISATYSTPSGL